MRFALGAAVILGACGSDAFDPEAALADLDAENYDSYSQVTELTGVIESSAIHGDFVQIWWNTDALNTVTTGTAAELPVGSTIFKEGYNDDAGSDLVAVTAMSKYDDGWFFARWDADGTATAYDLNLGDCTGCHSGGKDMILAIDW